MFTLCVSKTLNYGIIAGINSLYYRFKTCRSGYQLYENPLTHKIEMYLVNGDIIGEEDIATSLLFKF